MHDPELLVLDEPFSGLDPLGVETMADLLRTLAEGGVAVMFSSHQLDLVEDLCEQVVIIDRGAIVLEGAVRTLRTASSHRYLEVELRTGDTSTGPMMWPESSWLSVQVGGSASAHQTTSTWRIWRGGR